MDENNKAHNYPLGSNNDWVCNLTNIPEEDENIVEVDLSAIMRMATNLLQEDLLTNSVNSLGPFMPFPILPQNLSEKWMNTEFIMITKEEIQGIANELMEIKKELAETKEMYINLKEELNDMRAKNQGEQ